MSRIRDIRRSKNMSGTKVAKYLNISPQYYYDIEKGEKRLSAKFAIDLAKLFGVTMEYLLENDNTHADPSILTPDVESNSPTPSWATSKDKRDFKKMLEDDGDLMFDGVPIEEEDRQRIKDVLTGLFWEAKQMNKRKKKPDSTNDTKK